MPLVTDFKSCGFGPGDRLATSTRAATGRQARQEPTASPSGLTRQEVMAIAEHVHVYEIAAAAVARYLLKEPGGQRRLAT
jgi:hypothetical protein